VRVLVTGGTGSVGRAAVARLVASGHDVLVVGRRPDMDAPGAAYAVCDITDFAGVREAVRGCDAVVHLAAVPSPGGVRGPELFRANALGTFHVFEAAAQEGIRRVVQASSINAFGAFFGVVPLEPRYFPIDEEHPTYTTDPYSFSKEVVERIADYYWRREGLSSVSLRLPGVRRAPTDPQKIERWRQRRDAARALVGELAAMDEAARVERLRPIREWADAYRALRPHEPGAEARGARALPRPDGPLLWVYIQRFDFWAIVDDRDSAQAIERGLTADYEGSHALFVNDRHNALGCDTRTLARLFFPKVHEWKRPVAGSESLVSIAKAEELIGFDPEHPVGGW